MVDEPHKKFSYSKTTIYYQPNSNSLRYGFLELTEFFDADNAKQYLEFICDSLNERFNNDN